MARRGENIYKRKDGRWEGRYKAGYDANGKAKYRSVYAKTYQAVKEKLMSLKSAPVKHEHSGCLTVKELFEEWMSAVKLKVKISTYANYRMKADKHILPAFGGIRYEKLTTKMLHSFIEEKMKSGLSAKYVSDIVIVFKSMAKYTAITHNFQNPLTNVVLPKAEKKELHLLTESQQQQLCHTLMEENSKTSLCVLISMYTGLRVGEVCGLKWSDIDFEKSILTVNRTVQRIKTMSSACATTISIGKPKSRSSMRQIPLPEFLADMLNRFNQKNDSYVLSGSERIIEPRTMQYRFQSLLLKANLPSINYHALRHMFATNCVKAGFDVKTLSELLGHCSVETTLNRYVHSSMERKAECMSLLKFAA